jgi:hypothetical protein
MRTCRHCNKIKSAKTNLKWILVVIAASLAPAVHADLNKEENPQFLKLSNEDMIAKKIR